MKKNTHPKYQQILFVDTSTGKKFVCGSTLQPKETEKHEGVEYPVYRLAISSASHPLFTGSTGLVDAEGRVDKFRKRYAAKPAPVAAESAAAAEPKASAVKKRKGTTAK